MTSKLASITGASSGIGLEVAKALPPTLEAFFAAPEYSAVRQRLFEASVSAKLQLGKYTTGL